MCAVTDRAPRVTSIPYFLQGDGECQSIARAFDWATTPLGPPETWPECLKTTLGILFNSRQPMFLWWGPELIQFYNDAYLPSFGIGKHPKAMGQPGEACWPEIWPLISPQIRDVMERGISSWHENQLIPVFRNGHIEDVYWTYGYSPVFDEHGGIVGTLVTCQETTSEVLLASAQVQAREDAECAATANRYFTEAIPQQVWTANSAGEIVFVNQRVLDYFGAPLAEVVGSGWTNFVHPDDLPDAAAKWAHALASATRYEAEFRLQGHDGVYRWFLARAVPMTEGGGTVVQWFGTNTDVDEHNRLREALRIRVDFEQYLIGIVSHDLRSPLHIIQLGAYILGARADLDAVATKTILSIQNAVSRSTRLISDLLDFTDARVGGGLRVKPAQLNMVTLVSDVVDELRMVHSDRKFVLKKNGHGEGTWDGDRIAQAVMNLLSNASHYGDSDKPITITVDESGDDISLLVHNFGPPIDAATQPRLFEPLQRGAAQHDDHARRSVGLGLYIVSEIAREHQGRVSVESSAEAGTTFTISLPRHSTANGERLLTPSLRAGPPTAESGNG